MALLEHEYNGRRITLDFQQRFILRDGVEEIGSFASYLLAKEAFEQTQQQLEKEA